MFPVSTRRSELMQSRTKVSRTYQSPSVDPKVQVHMVSLYMQTCALVDVQSRRKTMANLERIFLGIVYSAERLELCQAETKDSQASLASTFGYELDEL